MVGKEGMVDIIGKYLPFAFCSKVNMDIIKVHILHFSFQFFSAKIFFSA